VESDGLLDTLNELKIGSIAFTPLAQGLLTSKYLRDIPSSSRANQRKSLNKSSLSETMIKNLNCLNDIAVLRGQSLAQMALAWVLRENRVTTALIGASNSKQVLDCVGTIKNLNFSNEELKNIDQYAKDESINLWAASAEL
jgi:L-glyceraldehyde 3-phosphate reductase